MTTISVSQPFPTFSDIDGQPLEDGYIWIGVSGLEPQANPQTAYWDAALTQVVTQPVRTRGGYPLNGTAIGQLFVGAAYSIKVQNKNASTIVLDLTGASGSGLLNSISFGTTGLTPSAPTGGDVVVAGTLAVANGGTGVTTATGTGSVVRATSPALTTPNLGTPSAATLTNATGLPLSTGVTGTLAVANGGTGITSFGTGVATALGQNVTGSGGMALSTNPTLAGATVASGELVLGLASSFATARIQQAGDSTAGATISIIRRFSNDTSAPVFILSKSRGTTASATTAVQNGDLLGSIFWQAADGSAFSNTAKIAAAIEGAPSAGSLPTSLEFLTTPSGSTTALQRFKILPAGGITSSDLADAVGYKGTPLNEQSTAYTLVIGDMGKSIVHPASDNNARTFTIPANGTVAFPVGTTITFINMINTVTIAITTDTMYLAGPGTTGSRTLAAYGMATAVKVTSTSWIISGNGLT